MLQRVLALISIASLCLLATMLTTTTPATVGPFGLLVIFITAYLSFVGLISFFLYGLNRIINLVRGDRRTQPGSQLSFRRAYYFSTIIAVAPVLLIGLQSVGSVGWYEVVLVLIFVGLGCLYVSKRIS